MSMMKSLAVAACVTLAAGPALAGAAANPGDLKVQTTRLLEHWSKKASGQLPTDVLDSFDYETFTTAAIEPHKAQFSAAQLAKFGEVFDALLRKTVHRQAGAALKDTRYTVAAAKVNGELATVEVKAHVPKDDLDTMVVFTWKKRGSQWRIVDLSIDGASLVRDYTNQFGRIIRKDGVDSLIAKLEKRLAGQTEESARL